MVIGGIYGCYTITEDIVNRAATTVRQTYSMSVMGILILKMS